MYDSLSREGQARFPYTLSVTLAGIAAMYIMVGLVPYLFVSGKAHMMVQDAITLNLPAVWWAYMVIGAYCIALLFSYPLMLFPVNRILEKGAGEWLRLRTGSHTAQTWKRNAFRCGVVALTLLVAWVGSSELDNLVALVGAFACTPLAFIFPALFHLRLVEQSTFSKAVNIVIIIFGCGVMIFSTWQAIAGWSVAEVDTCVLDGQ